MLIRKRSRRKNNLHIKNRPENTVNQVDQVGSQEIVSELEDIAKDVTQNITRNIAKNINGLRHHKQRAAEEQKMKRDSAKKLLSKMPTKLTAHVVTQRLDESLPLQTPEWKKVEQMLMRLSEFAPNEMVNELVDSLAEWADDQARRGYLLGQDDLIMELKQRNAA